MNRQLVDRAAAVLERIWLDGGSLSQTLRNYIRNSHVPRFCIPKLRHVVCGVFKWKRLLDYLQGDALSWDETVRCFIEERHIASRSDLSIGAAIRASCPDDVFEQLCATFGAELAYDTASALNTPPANTIRVNTIKISREELLDKLPDVKAVPCQKSSIGINLPHSSGIRGTQLFQKGYFEWQDEASQLVAKLVEPEPGNLIVDYCAGAGGKTLAMACSEFHASLQFIMHDVRDRARLAAIDRLQRAGVSRWGYYLGGSDKLGSYHGAADWVLVDAPCTGIGAWRRDPSLKWQTDEARIAQYVIKQRDIFRRALNFLADDGKIVYATCSLLSLENDQQVEYLCRTHNLEIVKCYRSNPVVDSMDGLFGAVLQRA